jgi:hypothetical protein
MDLDFRSTAYEILDPQYSIDQEILEKLTIASGEKRKHHARPVPETIVARINNRDVGFAVFDYSFTRPHKWFAVYVDIEYQGCRIGNALYEEISKKIGDYSKIVIIEESQTRARRFFEDRGFSKVYVSYFSGIDFNQIESKIESYFANNKIPSNIKVEKFKGGINKVSQDMKDLVTKYNAFIRSRISQDHEIVIEKNLLANNYVFDCTEVYIVRENNLIIGLISFSVWDSDCPLVDFLYVEPMESKKDFLIRMILVKNFINSGHNQYASQVGFFGNSLDLKSLNLLRYFNGELPYGYLTYELPFNAR